MLESTFGGGYMHARADSHLIFSDRRERRLEVIGQGAFVALEDGNDDGDYEFRSTLLVWRDAEVTLLHN